MRRLILILTAVAATGCASIGSGYVPLIDGDTGGNFPTDLADCQALSASHVRGEAFAAAGAIAAGVIGIILAPRGFRTEVFGRAAAIGALGGAAEGAGTQQDIIRRCMAGRGYRVLN